MQKQAPSLGRIATMVLFALSCFGLLLFLWLSFGGPIPLKPKGYQFKVAFPEATQLGLEADVRVAGVSVGKVRDKTIDPAHPNRTVATIEVDRKYAPIAKDARAILRQKTLLGETYVELTPGNKRAAGTVPDGGFLGDARVAKTVELDEIFQALDPKTRKSFQSWQQDLSKAVAGRGRDLNDALGNLPAFADDGNDLLTVLDGQAEQVSGLVRGTGQVFGALTQDEGQLHNLDRQRGRHLRRHLAPAGGAGPDVPDLPDLPRRVQGHLPAPGELLQGHRPARAGPAPGRARPDADAARRARAGARPAHPVRQPRPAHHGVEDRAAGAARHADAGQAAARPDPAVPRAAQPDPAVARVPPADDLGLHLQRRRGAGRHHRRP